MFNIKKKEEMSDSILGLAVRNSRFRVVNELRLHRDNIDSFRSNKSISIPEEIVIAKFPSNVSTFGTERAANYDCWLRAKVLASLNDPRPNVPHDQVMAQMRALIESKRTKCDAD